MNRFFSCHLNMGMHWNVICEGFQYFSGHIEARVGNFDSIMFEEKIEY
ncbi:hypothetical protein KPL47_06005 [Clostridium estertheticum]|nr:hypothetical protein [Clostridium estertheticum]MBU3175919.1 hypothetical protein [Clostridium estertheticum]